VRGEVLLGRDRFPLDTVGRFEHTIGGTDATDRTTVAWTDGTWSSTRGAEVADVQIAVRSMAVVPLGDSVMTRSIGAATASGRSGVGWIESVAQSRAKIP
jgi:hypothetical protein